MIPWWGWLIIAIVIAGTVTGILVWGLAYDGFGTDSEDATTTAAAGSSVRFGSPLLENASRGNPSAALKEDLVEVVIHDASPPTSEQAVLFRLGEEVDLTTYRVVEVEDDDIYFNHDVPGDDFVYYKYQDDRRLDSGKHAILFQQSTSDDIVTDLTNVSGKITSFYVHEVNDLFSEGFHPGDESWTPALLDSSVNGLASARVLAGVQPGTTVSSDIEEYDFNATNPISIPITLSENLPTLHVDDDVLPNMAGGLRLAAIYVDYTYTLGGSEQVLRLYLNHPTISMATKSIRDTDGVFKFVDLSEEGNPVLVTDYSSAQRPLSFWDQPYNLEEWEGEIEPMATAFMDTFKKFVVGIPIAVTNSSDVDLNLFSTATNGAKVNLHPDPKLSFQGATNAETWGKAWTAEELAANPAWQAILFDIPGINFRAEISF